ncbi:MAG: metallophosphoesterase family protein [bacterium]
MTHRTFAIGDIHGDLDALKTLMARLPELTATDTLVFVGDYIDRGPDSAGVVRYMMELPRKTPAEVICLRGNHEDGWLRALNGNWPQFVLPPNNGCVQAMRSFQGREVPPLGTPVESDDFEALCMGSFFPPEVIAWMQDLLWYYEDEFAIYVHAGLPQREGRFIHPSEAQGEEKTKLLWLRDKAFFRDYSGKPVVFGHTTTDQLPPELSTYTPDDPDDIWAGPSAIGLDTGCGKTDGFLTAVEFPAMLVYESR